eukprot:TRINITY_DN22776_c0_g1_i2.p1 TRINITY_DN22776_c0_g1~~TRINITY_DN22776_c0_g1_i2.p1  ORF type:complete len:261 (+),score=66.24 TRINITY_DN22776_c0_g1_i2:130-912(+)
MCIRDSINAEYGMMGTQDDNSTAEDWGVGERFGLGAGVSVGACAFALLVPAVRRYLMYEWESSDWRLLIARALAWTSFVVQVGSLTNDFIMSGNDDFNCIAQGCGPAGWETIDGTSTRKMSNYLMYNGCFYQLAIMVLQQGLFWVTATLRGQSIYWCLVWLVTVEYLGWYVPYIWSYGPFNYLTEIYKVCQWMPMVVAVVLLFPYYAYNDTILTGNGENQLMDDNFKAREGWANQAPRDTSSSDNVFDSRDDTGDDYFRT